jgi:hypothetical protein
MQRREQTWRGKHLEPVHQEVFILPDSDTPQDTSQKRAGSDTTASRFLIPETEQVQVEFGAATDVGHVRARNEDHYAIIRRQRSREIVSTNVDLRDVGLPHDESYLLIVADGAGGEGFGIWRASWSSAPPGKPPVVPPAG